MACALNIPKALLFAKQFSIDYNKWPTLYVVRTNSSFLMPIFVSYLLKVGTEVCCVKLHDCTCI